MFQTDPGLVPIPFAPDLWFLDQPLVWRGDDDLVITVPVGFISDDASTPKVLDWIPFLDRQGLSRRPGLAHDGLYSLGRTKGKAWADMMLEQFCLAEGMNQFQANCYYQGVHLFGDLSWTQDAREGDNKSVSAGDFVTAELWKTLMPNWIPIDPYRCWLATRANIYA
jgi:hypothetical protein